MVYSFFKHTLLTLALTLGAVSVAQAQVPPPPSQNQTGQVENTPLGGGAAPLTGGSVLLISLAAAYGIRKVRAAKHATNL